MVRDIKGKKGGNVMAVTKVTGSFAGETKDLKNVQKDTYQGEFDAPYQSGMYSVEIKAYDEGGNVSIKNASTDKELLVDVTKWHTPKTNWTVNDRFNFVDFNRIKNNILYLHEKAQELWRPFNIEDMGDDVFSYLYAPKVRYFNAFEKNLEIINQNILIRDYGVSQTFYEQGVFIGWQELNRIEGAILSMRGILDRQELSIRKIPITLGRFKEVRI